MKIISFLSSLMIAVLLYSLGGCGINGMHSCCKMKAKYERTETLIRQSDSECKIFTTEIHNGSVTVLPGTHGQCDITAKITAKADTVEDAQKLAEAVSISLKDLNGNTTVVVEKPQLKHDTISIDITATVDKNASLEIVSHNGDIKVSGNLNSQNILTHNGDIELMQTAGPAMAQTHNGDINVNSPAGKLDLETHNGNINIEDLNAAQSRLAATSYNGNVTTGFADEPSATVTLSTSNGKLKCDYPVTIQGEFNRHELKGQLGGGQGNIQLKTHNGNINIKKSGN